MPPKAAVRPATPPDMRLLTVPQAEAKHPALEGRVRDWIRRADAGDPDYIGLRRAIVRVGRNVFLNDPALSEFFYQRSAMPPAPSRRSTSTDKAAITATLERATRPARRQPVLDGDEGAGADEAAAGTVKTGRCQSAKTGDAEVAA